MTATTTPPLRLPQPAPETLQRGVGILTRYRGPTDHRGARITAAVPARPTFGGRVLSRTIPWDHGCSALENHYRAALAVLRVIESASPLAFTIAAIADTGGTYTFTTAAH